HTLGDDLDELEQRIDALPANEVSAETLTHLRTLLGFAKQGYSSALQAWTDNDSSASDPTRPGLTCGQYRAIGASYGRVVEQVNGVRRQYLGTLKAMVDALERDPHAAVFQQQPANSASSSAPTPTPPPVPTPAPSGSASRTTATAYVSPFGSGSGSAAS